MRRWLIAFKPETALAVGGYTPAVFTDKATARDERGLPVIPGTAVKGALRIELQRLHPGMVAAIARLFGTPGTDGGLLRFGNARCRPATGAVGDMLSGTDGGVLFDMRTGVAVSRRTRTAEIGLLFSGVTTAPFFDGITFEAEVTAADQPMTPDDERAFNQMLDGLKHVGIAIGSGRSRGLGWFSIEWQGPADSPPRQVDLPEGIAEWQVILTPLEEHRFSRLKPRGYLYETVDYIAGGTLRGAVAARLGTGHSLFKDLFFGANPARFGPLYPADNEDGSRPLPLSARFCKAHPGADVDLGPRNRLGVRRHGIRDILIHRLTLDAPDPVCPHCGSGLAAADGFYWWYGSGAPLIVSTSTHLCTKLALDSERQAAKIGKMYSYQCGRVPKQEGDRHYVGTITGMAREAAAAIAASGELWVGGARSRGMGRMKLELRPAPARPGIAERLDRLAAKPADNDGRCWFTLDAESDVVLPFGESLAVLLRRQLPDGVEFPAAFVRAGMAGGYNAALGMPKEMLSTAAMGSCIAASVPAGMRTELEQKLERLEREGIGLRRHEGYGRVRVCDEFHLLTDPA